MINIDSTLYLLCCYCCNVVVVIGLMTLAPLIEACDVVSYGETMYHILSLTRRMYILTSYTRKWLAPSSLCSLAMD